MPTSVNFCNTEKNMWEIKSATTYKSYEDSNIDDKEQVRDLGIIMSNTATFTLHIRNIVEKNRPDRMGVESVSVVEALSHADTLEISCHSPTRALLPTLESTESKRHTSYRSYSTNIYIQNHWSTALTLLGKTAQTQIILSPETPWTLYNYIYLKDHSAYCAKYDGTMGHKIKTRKHRRYGTQCIIQYSTNRNPAQSLQENEITVFGPRS